MIIIAVDEAIIW